MENEIKLKVTADTAEAESKLAALAAQRRKAMGGRFLPRMLAEDDGTPSTSRTITLLANLVWYGLLVARYFQTGQMPSPAEMLTGSTGASAPYIFNQAKRILEPLGKAVQAGNQPGESKSKTERG